MEKETVYVQRIKELQEELKHRDQMIESLLKKIQFYEETQESIVNKQNYIESVKEATELIKRAKSELRDIQTFKDELAQKIYTTFRS